MINLIWRYININYSESFFITCSYLWWWRTCVINSSKKVNNHSHVSHSHQYFCNNNKKCYNSRVTLQLPPFCELFSFIILFNKGLFNVTISLWLCCQLCVGILDCFLAMMLKNIEYCRVSKIFSKKSFFVSERIFVACLVWGKLIQLSTQWNQHKGIPG